MERLGAVGRTLHIVNPPVGFEIDVPMGQAMGFEVPGRLGADDVVFAFVRTKAEVAVLARAVKKALRTPADVVLWLAFPTGGVAEVTRDRGYEAFVDFKAVAIAAVDGSWSALRLRRTELVGR